MELNSELDRLQATVKTLMKYVEVESELERAVIKHPDYPTDLFKQLAIMQEEAGEVTKAVIEFQYELGSVYAIRQELIQTAAMCIRMIQNLPYSANSQRTQILNHESETPNP